MEVLIKFLHIVALGAPIVTILYLWYRRSGIEVDHIFLFSAGFVFYMVLPFTLAKTEVFSVHSVFPIWKKAFYLVPPQTWVWYFISLLLFYGAFIVGSWFGSKPLPQNFLIERIRAGKLRCKLVAYIYNHLQKIKSFLVQGDGIDPTALNIFFAITTFFIFLFGYPLRSYFFFGYQKSTQIPVFDSFVAASILLTSVAVCSVIYRYYNSNKSGWLLWRSLLNPAVISYCIVAFLLVSMGGRILVVSALMMIAVFFSVYIRRIRLLVAIAVFIALVLLSHVILLWRDGSAMKIFNPQQYYNIFGLEVALFSDNFNVGYSLMDFLGKYSIPIFRFPTMLLSNLVGLVPSFIFPAKALWMVDFKSLGYTLGGLSGGVNAYVSLVVNFGVVGASFFFFGLSYTLQRLKQCTHPITTAMYVLLSGWLAALFFRNFEQAIIKEMLQFSVLVPFALLVLSRIIIKRREKQKIISQEVL